ncbi:hypothetical protein FBY35_1539 [Streptomyces sp. SLBN-118]|nr:hypothetical protein FBY35_1539 [Streptomyces sp. SLBN-118]
MRRFDKALVVGWVLALALGLAGLASAQEDTGWGRSAVADASQRDTGWG